MTSFFKEKTMSSIKKKPKPFSAMSKVLCTGVQSRRIMVLSSLIMVLMGCTALYSAMQNEEWTRDEPSQRKVFFLAFLLLMSSIGLCYYALNGDLEEDNEKGEVERLTSVKYGGYNSIKSESSLVASERQRIDKITETKLLKLLEPQDQNYNGNEKRKGSTKRENSSKQFKNGKRVNSPIIYNIDEVKTFSNSSSQCNNDEIDQLNYPSNDQAQTYTKTSQNCVRTNDQNPNSSRRSLLVELMPLLPLQLAEKELSKLNQTSQENTSDHKNLTNRPDYNLPPPQNRIRTDLPCTFGPIHKNADAG